MPASLRIVIAEDAAIMRDGLTQTLIRRGHEVVAAVADATALREAVDTHLPDVAIIVLPCLRAAPLCAICRVSQAAG